MTLIPFSERKGLANRKMFVCLSVQPIRKQHFRISVRQQISDAKLRGGRLSIVPNQNLGSVLLKTLLVSQKPMEVEFSEK